MGNLVDRLEEPITDKETQVGEGNGLRYGVSGMQGWRTTMEDSHTAVASLPGLPEISFFGIYDGHGGPFTAKYVGSNILSVFSKRKELRAYASFHPNERDDVPGVRLLKAALNGTFVEIDEDLRNIQRASQLQTRKTSDGDEIRRDERSGSTCVIVLITPKHIICANAGDSRACYQRNAKVLPLSFDHKPSNCAELSRIKNAGGTVTLRRVDGDLAVSRGLGDFQYKGRPDLPPERQKVSCIPDITVYPRNDNQDELITLACDGIWDVVSNKDCLDLIQGILDEGETNLGLVCEEMLDICLEKESRDNMSIIVIACPNVRYGEGMGVSGRRAKRRLSKENDTQTSTRNQQNGMPQRKEIAGQ
mmetsp:Transcript_33636/g.41197  ORF Transcript_33636/g.41197 Transcript_33636/m.41197 type:complete len:362 (+) Transcript_33636:66-1151(+)|eukprot:CAMPEP_0172505472 /NCGR_PEP_ID=MMETSP1066-20121228/186781_1 /TAXON_ID=671091 /ORGANISM="Coscinodiscus wailesii, Strain CCMP2513" /LENGTH=361 /DNA_ID=CAMNT_0013282089 /DNA_START=53 /DNA_END=1138 /DNA_ORIENTATION=-